MPAFSQPCYQQLNDILVTLPVKTASLHFMSGAILAVAAAPEIPLPGQWIPWLLPASGQMPDNSSEQQLSHCLMDCFQWQLARMRESQPQLMPDLPFPPSHSKRSPLSQWMQGLLFAHTQVEKVWQLAWQNMLKKHHQPQRALQKDLRHCLSMFSTFADIPLAIEQAEQKGNVRLADALPRIYLSLGEALRCYVQVAGQLTEFLPNQFETFVQASPPGH